MASHTDPAHPVPDALCFMPWPGEPPRVAFAADTDEAITYLAPVIGPSATLALFAISRRLRSEPGFWWDLRDLAHTIGLGLPEQLGPNSQILKTIRRLTMFGYLRPAIGCRDLYEVRTRIPALSRRHLERLPATLRDHAPTV